MSGWKARAKEANQVGQVMYGLAQTVRKALMRWQIVELLIATIMIGMGASSAAAQSWDVDFKQRLPRIAGSMAIVQTYHGKQPSQGEWVAGRYQHEGRFGLVQFYRKKLFIADTGKLDSERDIEVGLSSKPSGTLTSVDVVEKKRIRLKGFPQELSTATLRKHYGGDKIIEDRIFVTSYSGMLVVFRYAHNRMPTAEQEAAAFMQEVRLATQ